MGDHLKGGYAKKKKITIGILAHVDAGKPLLARRCFMHREKFAPFLPFGASPIALKFC